MNVHTDLICESAELTMKCNDSSEGTKVMTTNASTSSASSGLTFPATEKGGIRSDE